MHIRNRIDKKEDKIYVVMAKGKIDNSTCNINGKICCTIQKGQPDIVVSPGYSKTYLKDMFCNNICDYNKQCLKRKWDNSCFVDSIENFKYNKIHVTRHNTVLHYADDNKKMGILRWNREPLSEFSKYEFVAGYSFSPKILSSDISKDYLKSKENEVILLSSNGYNSFNIYVFINPKNSKELFEDLKKHNFEIAKYEYQEYDIVIVIQTIEGVYQTAINGFTNMYINTHPDLGIGNFKPLL